MPYVKPEVYLRPLTQTQKRAIRQREALIAGNLQKLSDAGERSIFERTMLLGKKGYTYQFFAPRHNRFVSLNHKCKYTKTPIPFTYKSFHGF